MAYEQTLAECDDPAVGSAVIRAVASLLVRDGKLLAINVAEETIAAQLMKYLSSEFPDYDVDVEYNRMGNAPKTVTWGAEPAAVYPDIIVHRRATTTNVLAIEIKKTSNPQSSDDDKRKLAAYRKELGYKHALFLRLGVGDGAGTVSECVWVRP